MIKSLSHKEQLKAFINAAQYFAGLTSGQDIWEEAGRVLINLFGADVVTFVNYRNDRDVEINHWAFSERGASTKISEPEVIAAARDVFESGFLTFFTFSPKNPIATAFLPILHENRPVAVMMVGHRSSTSLAKDTLDLYLAIAGLIGAANSRKISDESIRQFNKELEQRVIDRTAQLEITNKELESFAYAVSHDLRAPLRSIGGFSHAILEEYADKLDANGKDYLNRIREATNKMGQLIDALLNVSRLTRTEINYMPVNMSQLAQATAEELRKSQPGRYVELVITDGLIVNGDSAMLHIVIENLLGNAWKYTGRCETARIEFGVTQKRGRDVYFVRDNGAGFDMAYANKLFNAFQRLHKTADFPGLGIGLATVQRIIHRHGGSIWAEAEVGKGATFYFTLQ